MEQQQSKELSIVSDERKTSKQKSAEAKSADDVKTTRRNCQNPGQRLEAPKPAESAETNCPTPQKKVSIESKLARLCTY